MADEFSSHVNSEQMEQTSLICGQVKQSLYRPGQALRLYNVEAPRFQDIQHMKVVRLSALCTGYLSSSSLAQQPLLSEGLLQKLLSAVSIPCSIPPISLPQLPGIFHHTIFPS